MCLVGNQHSQKSVIRKTGEKIVFEIILNKQEKETSKKSEKNGHKSGPCV